MPLYTKLYTNNTYQAQAGNICVIFAHFLNNLILLSEYGTMNNLTNFEIIVISNLSRLNKISAQLITEEFSISIINIAGTTD